jgi:hypothetical protein
VPCTAIVGSSAEEFRRETEPFCDVFTLEGGSISPERAMRSARELLADCAEQAIQSRGNSC